MRSANKTIFNNYTSENIFSDQRQNEVCDRMFESLQVAFPEGEQDSGNLFVFHSCILSGKAAAIMRGDMGEIRNVTFQVDNIDIYNWLAQNLGTEVFKCNSIGFKNRILLYPLPDLFFEIWFNNKPNSPNYNGSIYFQSIEEIPTQTL
jgi:hypothetical protein